MSKRCRWSTQHNRILVEILLVQKAAGNQAQSGWKSTVWNAIAAELRKVAVDGEAERTPSKCNDHYSNVCARHTFDDQVVSLLIADRSHNS